MASSSSGSASRPLRPLPGFSSPAGRFAPSPTGDFHVGNLRTAMLAWLFARSQGQAFYLRVEDLDRVRAGSEASQLADLAVVGVDFEPSLRQSDDLSSYGAALKQLAAAGHTYECFCSRKEIAAAIAEAASAPNAPDARDAAGANTSFYPGTCRSLTEAEREAGRAKLAETGRQPAIRLRASSPGAPGTPSSPARFTVQDRFTGEFTGEVDDFVLRRNDGAFAYNLVCVVDDARMGITEVVRGDDLLDSAPRQGLLASLLGVPAPFYSHVPLVLGPEGKRLAKRDGAVTLADLAALGMGADDVVQMILGSLELPHLPAAEDGPGRPPRTLAEALRVFSAESVPAEPWVLHPQNPASSAQLSSLER